MSKYLITGFSGFVSQHFLDYLDSQSGEAIVLGIDVHLPEFSISHYKNIKCTFTQVDMLMKEDLQRILHDYRPDFVLHLASYSSVAYSWQNPATSFSNNTNIFLNLLEAIRINQIPCRILSIGSSEEYGVIKEHGLPIKETHSIDPTSPYAVARVSQEMLSQVYIAGFNFDIIMTRSFNHIGPFQKDIFVISSFAKQLVSLAISGNKAGTISTGDTSIIRDFIDVRDVVSAYYLLFKKGQCGEIYNICSGKGQSLTKLIHLMANKLDLDITELTNPALIRPIDNPIIIGSNEKISCLGWSPTYSIDETLNDLLHYWTHNLS